MTGTRRMIEERQQRVTSRSREQYSVKLFSLHDFGLLWYGASLLTPSRSSRAVGKNTMVMAVLFEITAECKSGEPRCEPGFKRS
jgi:hypothetical protein